MKVPNLKHSLFTKAVKGDTKIASSEIQKDTVSFSLKGQDLQAETVLGMYRLASGLKV